MRFIYLLVATLVLSGCAAKPLAPDHYYRVSTDRIDRADSGVPVVLRRIETPGVLGGRALLVGTQVDPLVIQEVRGHLWASPPNAWLTDLLLTRGMTDIQLVTESLPTRAERTLMLALTDLFINPADSAVVVGLSGMLKGASASQAVRCRSTQQMQSASTVEAGAVAAFESALDACFADLDRQVTALL